MNEVTTASAPRCFRCGQVMRASDVQGRYVCPDEAEESHDQRKDNKWHPYAERMSKLAESFPALGRWKMPPGVRPWDPAALLEQHGSMSHGEQLVVRFLIGVWGGGAEALWNMKPFDFFEAWGCWDDEQRAAFVAWARAPFWP